MSDLIPACWQNLLTTRALGRQVHYAHTLPSTNTVLKDLAKSGAPHGTICLCEQQTTGRGRLDRSWSSPEGQGVWISTLLRPKLSPENAPLITFCVAMAMAQSVREVSGLEVRIKWPNDLVVQGRKLCGILLEMGFDASGMYIVAGAGLNVRRGAYPPDLANRAIAIEECTEPPARGMLIAGYLSALEASLARLEQEGFAGIEADYRAQSCTLGSRVHVLGAETFTGIAEAIDDTGALLVRRDDGTLQRVLAGDVSVRGVMGYV